MRLVGTAFLLLALPACIELDEELFVDPDVPEDTGGAPTDGPERPDRPDTPDDEPTPAPADTTLTPDRAERCDILLVSITTEAADDVEDVHFFGPSDLEVLTFDVRPDELLVTVQVPDTGELGANDLLLELADGDTVFVEDVFEIDGDAC